MTVTLIDKLTESLGDLSVAVPIGDVAAVGGGMAEITGLSDRARLGDRLSIQGGRAAVFADVVRLRDGLVFAMIEHGEEGVAIGQTVRLLPRQRFAPDDAWLGRVVDPEGQPMDGWPLMPGLGTQDIHNLPPPAHHRRPLGTRLETGLAVMNTLLPIVRGQRVGLFAGSGVGKSTLLADLARGVKADVVVIALVGERGREVRHFAQDVLDPEARARTVIVAATSDRGPRLRRRCAWAATAVAEHFRDQGKQVLLLVDSVTRFCEAHREVAVLGGEAANLRGFPPSTAGAIATLCERAGPGAGDGGDITAIYTVLVAGSDMDEPVADMMRGILDGHIVLDREIAERGRFPAIDVLRSVSRSLPGAADRVENAMIADARRHMAQYDRAAMMVQAGLYEAGSDSAIDAAIACHEPLEDFVTIKDRRDARAHFAALRRVLDQAEQGRG